MNQNLIRQAVRGALFAGAAASLAHAPQVLAQEQDEAAELGKQTVTGSRIRRVQIEGANPVTVLSRDDIERSGLDSVGKILQELPGMTGSPQNTNANNGGSGAVRVDLRGMGSGRTLVLVNGRRMVAGGGTAAVAGTVDLDTIPTNIVERIEILAQGASPIYGADAVAGVVNIITRQDYDGMEVGAFYDQAFEGDADIYQLSFVTGLTTGRGNITVGAQYTEQEGLLGGARPDWNADVALALCGEAGDACAPFGISGNTFSLGSSRIPQGFFNVPAGNTLGLAPGAYTRDPNDGSIRPFISTGPGNDTYNFAPVNYIQTPNERTHVWLQGRYDLFEDLSFFVEGMVHSRQSAQQLAPVPYDSRTDPGSASADSFYNPFGVDITDVRRRFAESGRVFTQISDTWRFVGGLQGTIGDWDWEAAYSWGQNDLISRNFGQLSGERLDLAMGPSFQLPDGSVVCGDPGADGTPGTADDNVVAGCVPLNIFGGFFTDPFTPEMLDYIQVVLNDTQQVEQKGISAYITGDLAQLPAGPLGLAFGVERREQAGFFFNDSSKVLGQATGNVGNNTEGLYNVNEAYVELAIPILSGVPVFEALELTVGGRYSDFSNFGSNETFQGGLRWQPHEDLLLRGTYSEVFREPSITELFLGNSDSFPTASDPCGNNPSPSQRPNCQANGVPGGSYNQSDNQIRQIVGGNAALQPEEGETVTIGVAYSPGWLDGFTVTLDYWDIDIDAAIGIVQNQTVLQQCADTGDPFWCDRIQRLANGEVDQVAATNTNLGFQEASGYDFELEYNWSTTIGDWRADLLGTYLEKRNTELFPGGPVVAQAGNFDISSGTGTGSNLFPRWRGLFSLDWSMGPWAASYQAQMIHHVDECIDPNGLFGNGGVLTGSSNKPNCNDVPSKTYHDIQGSYSFGQGTRVSLLLENFTDENPPLIIGGTGQGTDNRSYRLRGASWLFRVTHNFQ